MGLGLILLTAVQSVQPAKHTGAVCILMGGGVKDGSSYQLGFPSSSLVGFKISSKWSMACPG